MPFATRRRPAGTVDLVAHGSTHDRPGRTARLMLLLATLLGLAAMHTLGHHGPHVTPGHHDRHPAAGVVMSAAGIVMSDAGVVMSAAEACGCGAILAAPMPGGDGTGGWDVCLAVLVAFAVLLLAAVLLRASRAAATAHQPGRSGSVRPRGPPAGRVGLLLATVSVLRT